MYYVAVRDVTSSADEFMSVSREFARGECSIKQVAPDVIDKWENGSKHNEEAYAFAKAIIIKYIDYYTI